ncbi:MAG: cation diffusion facilitator family transporter [Treponemataceae bacterium]|nr:cation diffusion facilitator family transporter [Treponemataceae bacterium]
MEIDDKEKTEAAKEQAGDRDSVIIRTSILGIVANVFLSAFKAAVGILSNSIAVVLDAVNNLSDALSSVITIVGTKLASRFPDKKHPLGYGRIEYMSALLVAAIILYAGATSAVESVKKIIEPEKADYSAVSLVIIASSVLVKLLLGFYVRHQGKKTKSGALTSSGSDALFDAVLSLSVLLSAVIYLLTGLSLEAYVGVLISVFIIKAGIEMMKDTLDEVIGKRADSELTKKIKKLITAEEGVRGAYDLILNNYGTDRNYASVHVELPDSMTVDQVDVLTRKLEMKVYKETGVILTSVGVYSYNTKDDESSAIREKVLGIVKAHDWAIQLHGFYVDLQSKIIRFDVVMSFEIKFSEGLKILCDEIKTEFPAYKVIIAPDVDISD